MTIELNLTLNGKASFAPCEASEDARIHVVSSPRVIGVNVSTEDWKKEAFIELNLDNAIELVEYLTIWIRMVT
jgi:hypothetical protein